MPEIKVPAKFTRHRIVRMRHENDFEVQARVDDATLRPQVRTYDGVRVELTMTPGDARAYAYALLAKATLAEELAQWERANGTKPRKV